MRYTELICLLLFISFSSSIISTSVSQISKLNKNLEEIRKKTESLIFISDSFSKICEDETADIKTFDEWKNMCKGLWNLEQIEWESCPAVDKEIYFGRWTGPYGNGEVYGKKAVSNESKNKCS